MFRITVGLLMLSSVLSLAQDVAGYTLAEDGVYRITVHHVFCGPPGKPSPVGCRIHYSYRFERRTSVHIAELGEVPATGEFDYISREPRITFLESSNPEAILTFVDVKETAVTRGDPIPTFPAFRDFPPTPVIVGRLPRSGIFFNNAQNAIVNSLKSRYDPDEIRNGIRYLITDYSEIKTAHPNLMVQVAIMISHPEPAEDSRAFRIRWIAREKNKLEDDWRPLTSAGRSASFVNAFLAGLRREIENLTQ